MSPRVSLGLLLAGIAGLGWVHRATGPAPTPAPAVSAAYTHANLSVFVVRAPDTFDAGNVMTLQEALAAGLAVVHETGDVNNLAVENTSDNRELFLQSGDIVKGGKQDRIIGMDMLLPPKSGKVGCPANCCEQRRWTARGGEAVTHFAQSSDFAVGNELKKANVNASQGEVWANVAKKQQELSAQVGKSVNAAASPTSLQLALEDKDLVAKLAAYEAALAKAANYPDAVGVIVAVNGQVIAADVYGSAKLFKKVWPKLLKSAAADALAQLPAGPVPAAPSVAAANEFLASAGGAAEGRGDTGRQVEAMFEAVDTPTRLNDPARANQVVNLWQQAGEGRAAAGQQPAPQPQPGFAGRSGVTVVRNLQAAGGANLNPSAPQTNDVTMQNPLHFNIQNVRGNERMGRANVGEPTPLPAPQHGVTVIESRAAAQPGAVLHRSVLK